MLFLLSFYFYSNLKSEKELESRKKEREKQNKEGKKKRENKCESWRQKSVKTN
jgi:hypothetical protein